MSPSGAGFFLFLLATVLLLVVLYFVIRLAVTHAIRAAAIWRHDGRFEVALEERKRDLARMSRGHSG